MRSDPSNAQSDSTVIVRPRPDLASATRRWPQLVMASQGTELKLVFGYMIALLVGMSALGIVLLYNQFQHAPVGPLGRGLLMAFLAGAAPLVLKLSGIGKRLRVVHAV